MKLTRIVQGLALAGLASAALAQTGEQRITITGSSIKRIATEGALPVQVITRSDLEREGITSAEQVVMLLSTNGNGLDNLASNADVVGGAQRGNNGATSANLRGQGANATLILLNGRRVAAHGLNGGVVDLNQIPMTAIERIEILKDGASAIYGTDAIGGVINFILRTNFTGLRAQAIADVTEAGGGNVFRGSIVGGFGDLDRDGFNILGTIAYADAKAFDEQMAGLERYLAEKPYDAQAHLVRGYNLRFSGQPTAAIAAFRRVLEIAPENRAAALFLDALAPANSEAVLR